MECWKSLVAGLQLEAGREEQSSPTFELTSNDGFVCTSFTFALKDNWSIQSKCRQVIFQAQIGNR